MVMVMTGKSIAAARTPNVSAKLDIINRRPAEFGGRLEKLRAFKEIIEHPRRLPSLDKKYSDEKGKNEALSSFCSFVLDNYSEGTAKKQSFSTLVGKHVVEIDGSMAPDMMIHIVVPDTPAAFDRPARNGPKVIIATRNLGKVDAAKASFDFNSESAVKALAKALETPHIKARLTELLKGELSVLEGRLRMAEDIARSMHTEAKRLLKI